MRFRYYLGIDPGKSGALGAITHLGKFVARTDGSDPHKMREMLVPYPPAETFVVMEKVHAMPFQRADGRRQGATSLFSFGENFGMWQGVLAGMGFRYVLIAPQTWKAVMLRDTAKDKEAAATVASALFPELAPRWKAKSASDLAEAMLMAEYGVRLG